MRVRENTGENIEWGGHNPAWTLRPCLYSNVMIPRKG